MTKKKRYLTSHVSNPTSMQHLVWLQPGQTILLHLDKTTYQNPKVELSTSFLKMFACADVITQEKEENQYLFIQSHGVPEWSEYSSCFLGDIWVDSDNVTSRIVVMLECKTTAKRHFVTVVNPICTDLRIKPHNILEVILYDLEFRDMDEWMWEWKPSSYQAEIEQIGYDYVNFCLHNHYHSEYGGDAPERPYARCPRDDAGNNSWCRQHHFWFRFAGNILDVFSTENSIKHVGDMKFFGFPNRYERSNLTQRFLSLNLDLRARDKSLVFDAQNLMVQSQCPSMTIRHNLVNKDDWQTYIPMVYDINIQQIDSKCLEDGCTTLPAFQDHNFVNAYLPAPDPRHIYGTIGRKHYPIDDYEGNNDWWAW